VILTVIQEDDFVLYPWISFYKQGDNDVEKKHRYNSCLESLPCQSFAGKKDKVMSNT